MLRLHYDELIGKIEKKNKGKIFSMTGDYVPDKVFDKTCVIKDDRKYYLQILLEKVYV